MGKKHVVQLTEGQRADLERRFAGPLTLRQRNRVQVCLRSDASPRRAGVGTPLLL